MCLTAYLNSFSLPHLCEHSGSQLESRALVQSEKNNMNVITLKVSQCHLFLYITSKDVELLLCYARLSILIWSTMLNNIIAVVIHGKLCIGRTTSTYLWLSKKP